MKLQENDKAPEFNIAAIDNSNTRDIALSDYKGQYLLLYFYPKDDTSGCAKEAIAFRDNLQAFADKNCAILGISKDDLKAHAKFIAKYELNFPLLGDVEMEICQNYNVWVEKSMYGRTYMGIERSTFLIDPEGIIRKVWRKVKVADHDQATLKALEELQASA